MVDLDGKKYIVSTPSENTKTLVDRINTYCTDNNVVNSKGEIIEVAENFSSPLYLILWAFGYLVTVLQNLIVSVAKVFSIQESSDDQLLNLADVAGIKRGSPSVTTFGLEVIAMTSEDSNYDATANDGNLVITSEDTITYQGVIYKPALFPSITIEPGQHGYLTMVAQTEGSQVITEGNIQQFDSTIANLASLKQDTSIPGQDQESIASLRERIQRRTYSGTSIDAAIDAIRALPGITVANIIYNTMLTTPKYVGEDSLELPGRYAMVIVQGYNQNIAEEFYNHLSAPTIEFSDDDEGHRVYNYRNIPEDRILELQTYTTHAQQALPVLVLKPRQKELSVQVYVGMPIVGSLEQEMKDTIASYVVRNSTIGQSITAAMILSCLTSYNSYGILGAQVAAKGTTFSYKTVQAEDVIWTLNTDNITIVMPEADN